MKGYLKAKGVGDSNNIVVGPVPSKNQSKYATKKNNVATFNTILNGISYSIKESIGKCTSTKDLWLKLEKAYQYLVINEGKYYPKYFDCNTPECNEVECYPTNEEEDVEVVCIESNKNYLIDEEGDLLILKIKLSMI
jgi:hypothetical protein